MPKVAISADFLAAFARIPRRVQKKVREFTEKFLHDPTQASIHYESLHGMKDPKVRTVRVGLDYRAIVLHPPRGDVYVCVWVDHHDEAMAWARRKRFEVNPTVGSFQIYEVEEDHHLVEAEGGGEDEPLPEDRLLGGRTRADLRTCGVPDLLIPSVCLLKTEGEMEALKHYLPAGVADVLSMLAAGYEVREAIRESSSAHEAGARVDPDDFAAAMEHPGTRRRFKIVERHDDLDELLRAPQEVTRTLTHGRSEAVFLDAGGETESFPVDVEVDGELFDRQLPPGDRWIFGRATSCDVILRDSHISRQQFELHNLGSQVEVKPFPSKNQIQVVGHRDHGEVYFTLPRVEIRIGGTVVTVRRSNIG